MLRNPGLRKSVEQPVLDLNFAASQIGSNGAPDRRIDFSRGNNAWFVDSDGLVKKSPHNLVLNSQSIANGVSGWSVGSTTESSLEAPDGLDGSTKITFAGTDQVYVLVSVEAGQEYRFSYYVKLGTKPNNRYAIYDHTNSSFIVSSSVVSGVSSDEWTRVSFEVTAPAGCTQIRFYVDRADSAGEIGTTFITGVQVSQHTTLPVGNPYIKTEGSAAYAARLDHDPTWFMSAAQEQNLLEHSEMLDDSYWTKSVVNVTANAETDPLGGTTAEYIFATSPSGTFPQILTTFDAKKGAVHTASFYAKAGEIDIITAQITKADGTFVTALFANEPLTSEWQRFSATFTATEDTHTIRFFFGSGAKTWTGDQGFYIWGTQIEVGSTASTYHRTEGAPYYGPGATPKGLLIEEARTNIITDSESHTYIDTDVNVTQSGSAGLAPDGTNTAIAFMETAATGDHVSRKSVTIADNQNIIFSFFVKANGRTDGQIEFFNAGGGYANFDLTAGTIDSASVYSSATNGSTSIEDYGNGWFRVSLGLTTVSGDTSATIQIRVHDSAKNNSYAGDTSKGLLIWGLQLEQGSFPTSYIQTTGTTLTRNADVATMGPTTGGTELVTNGTFDTDTTGWNDFGGRSNISVSSGQLVVDVTNASFGFVARTDVDGGYNPVVVPGRRYRLSADLKVNSGNGVEIDVYGSGSPIAATGVVTSGTLTTKTVDFTCPDGVTSVTLFVDNIAPRATTDEYVIDNVSVRELYPFEQYNPEEGTIHLEASFPFTPAVGDFTTLLRLEGGSASSDRIDLRVDGTPKIGTQVRANNATTQVAGFGSNVTADELFRVGLAYKEDDFLAASNKLLNATADTSGAIPALQKITFVVIDSNPNAGHLKRVKYFKRRIPEKHLQSLMDPYNV